MQTGAKNAQEKLSLMEMPTTDSTGRELSAGQREYFKDSKVIDGNGNLLVMYHGTTAYGHITVFKRGKKGWLGPGIYLTSSRSDAQRYADAMGEGNGRLYEMYANITKPLVVTDGNPVPGILKAAYGRDSVYKSRSEKQSNDPNIVTQADINKLRAKGYDGIVWDYGRSKEVSVFSPEQVKLADNVDPTSSKDIRYSLMEDAQYMADIDKAVAGVLSIETKLAEKNWSSVELRNIPAMYNPTKKADFEKAYDAIDWAEYYKTMGIGDFEQIIVTTPSALANANELMKTAPLEDIRYYLAAQYIGAAASYLSDDFINASFDFFGRAMSGKQEQKPRWKRAMSVPNGTLSEAVGEMYVAKYFPEKDKARMLDMVKNLQTALGQHIAALDWMSDATKAKAQEKLAAFTVKIGYPDKWKDYTTLKIDPAKSYWENIVEANAWYTSDNISKLGKPVDKDEWHMSPQTVNAYYNPTTNEICFPAAILQPPFYNPDADDAVNYGAIGVVIGHEMTHGFDDQGRNFDKDGNMNNWWTDEDAAAFKAKTDILVKQFDAIKVLPAKEGQPAIFANGALSLGENIADQGGLRVARTAYRNSLAGREAPAPIDGFTPEQRFYLGYATLWAQNIRDEEIARLTKLDVHSLGKWRVNATLRNLQDFYDAFSIADGPMFLPEQDRVIIW